MKKVIGGKLYNTEAAKFQAEMQYLNVGDLEYYREKLFKTKSGHFFIHVIGGPNSRYSKYMGDNSWSGSESILPIDEIEARKWVEENCDGEEYENIFGEISEEDSVKISADITVSDKALMDAIKAKTGETTGELISRLLKNEK